MSFDYTGVFAITPTPFRTDGELDEPSIARLVEFLIDSGVQGLTILGVLGEAHKLSDAEQRRVVELTIRQADGRVPVVVGVTHPSLDVVCARIREAADLGAAGVMVQPISGAKPNPEGVYKQFKAFSEAASTEIVIQDRPAFSGVTMSVPDLVRIATDFPNVRAIKMEDDPTPVKLGELHNALRTANVPMQVFGGLGAMFLLEELKRGAIGTMTGFSFPEVIVDVYQRFARGDVQGATDIFFHYLPLIRYEFLPIVGLSLRKTIYMNRGVIRGATVRAPAPQLNADTLAELYDLVRRLGLNPGRQFRQAPEPPQRSARNGNGASNGAAAGSHAPMATLATH